MSSPRKVEHGRLEFSSQILARLGEELNASLEQGIIELVKNSYDADAKKCHVALDNASNPGGSITVEDNGDGMATEAIQDNWLVLGRSPKNRTKLTRLGRIPVGNKGLGRLAALRLGRWAELSTRHYTNPELEHQVRLDWAEFDKAGVVGKVRIPIRSRSAAGGKKGTRVHLGNLRQKVGRVTVKRLARALLLLADPFGEDPNGFKPTLKAPEFKDLEKLVRASYYSDAEYRLTARLDSEGIASAELRDWRGLVLFRTNHADLARKRKEFKEGYPCPPGKLDLWAFLMTAKSFSTRAATVGEVREWLKHFGGVHLYQDEIRVSPYGDPGNDWLDMNLARVRDPELRPSTNNSIGRLRIEGNDQLLFQKTDRTGYIETPAFRALRSFCQDALDWMQSRRLEIREKNRSIARKETKQAASKESKGVRDAIDELRDTDDQASVRTAFDKYERARKRQITELNEEVQLYRTLATAGIAAATFAHESDGGSLKRVAMSLNTLERRARKNLPPSLYEKQFEKPVARIREAVTGLGVLGEVTLRLVEHQKRRSSKVYVHSVIRDVFKTYRPFLSNRGVKVSLELAKGRPFLFGSQAAMESVVTNLLNNSAVAFEGIHRRKRRIVVRTSVDDHLVMALDFMDNGTGVTNIPPADIWLPGKTTRQSGTGLGLTIVRDATVDLSGEVSVEPKGELGGATFRITLPLHGFGNA